MRRGWIQLLCSRPLAASWPLEASQNQCEGVRRNLESTRSARAVFFERGWYRFPFDPRLFEWVTRTLASARNAVQAKENAQFLLCGGTWFSGTKVLKNSASGAVSGGPQLSGLAVEFIQESLLSGPITWDQAQVSVCYPGYPRPMKGESEAAYRYRRNRDAAHIDGLLALGSDKRRYLQEHHAFLLGIPMVEASTDASPFVVWERSHEMIRATFRALFQGIPAHKWRNVDASEEYWSARREIVSKCERVEIPARPGEAYLVHRLALHGMAPWASCATSGADGRMIVYFRPLLSSPQDWLEAP